VTGVAFRAMKNMTGMARARAMANYTSRARRAMRNATTAKVVSRPAAKPVLTNTTSLRRKAKAPLTHDPPHPSKDAEKPDVTVLSGERKVTSKRR